jgi:hypothetical protein
MTKLKNPAADSFPALETKCRDALAKINPPSKAQPDPAFGWLFYLESELITEGSPTSWIALPPLRTRAKKVEALQAAVGGHTENVRIPSRSGPPYARRFALVMDVPAQPAAPPPAPRKGKKRPVQPAAN